MQTGVHVEEGFVPTSHLTKTWPRGESVSKLETEKAAFAALSLVELAGLEPATSWVRSRRSPS